EQRTATPMIDLGLFRRRAFSAAIASGLLSYLVLFGVLFVVPFFLEQARHASPTRAGLELTVLPLAIGVTAPAAGRIADRVGARLPTAIGMAVTTAGLMLAALVHPGTTAILLELAVIGLGLGAFTPANNAAIMSNAPREHSGMTGGVLNMTRSVGTAFGVAVTGLVFGVASRAHTVTSGPGPAGRGFAAALWVLAAASAAAAVLAALRTVSVGHHSTTPAVP
ncbi:MAG TPA: MFS transporter, partial [Mycobacteriales bacterium]|nr:MFS transporter [Mycobacteriales bacterium]